MGGVQVYSTAVQVVSRNAGEGGRVRVSGLYVQVVSSLHVDRIRVSNLALQVVHQGNVGARMRDTTTAVQVVYTTGAPDTQRQRAWTFDFDGHTFYALDLGEEGTLVYDFATGAWARFETQGYSGHWNMKNGFQWVSGKKVVAGDIAQGLLWYMVPNSGYDEGWRPIETEVRGLLLSDAIESSKVYALRLHGAPGVLGDTEEPVLYMRFSDDNGATWSEEYSHVLTTGTRERIEWRSLGSFAFPGRIFRFYDHGGLRFIGYVKAEVG
jgi:hypothetical protein